MNKEFKTFDKILVKQGVWRASFFSHYREDGYVITTSGGVYAKKYVLPFEGNTCLVGTDVEPVERRWRAEEYESYWYIDSSLEVFGCTENNSPFDDGLYNVGNYFKTEEAAKAMAEKIKKILNR